MSRYLLLRPSGYYFRIGIPADVRPVFNRRELKISLPTADKKSAVQLANYCALRVTAMIKSYRGGTMKFGRMDRVIISNFESTTDRGTIKIDQIEVDGEGDTEKEIAALKETLTSILHGGSPFSVLPVDQPIPSLPSPVLRLSELVKRFCEEKELTEKWTKKTTQEYSASYAMLQRVLGDIDVNTMTRNQATNYLDILKKLPPNVNKNPLYKGKSLDVVIQMEHASTLSPQSINKHLVRASMLFGWAQAQKYASNNHFASLSVKKDKRAHEQRFAFRDEHLHKLFSHDIFTQRRYKHSYMFWVPLIALYTGMRLEEVCQLHTEDIRVEDDVWIIDVNANEEKKVKNDSSWRFIPVHSELIRLGFIDFCDSKRAANQKRLFGELKYQRDGYSQAVSKWFGRFRSKCGVKGRGFDFHSFRHTVADKLQKAGVDEKHAKTILGHAAHGITFGRYGKGYLKMTLKDVVETLKFDLPI